MHRIKLSNQIFSIGLSNTALCIYAYLCSLNSKTMMNGEDAVKVKQATIAAACGIRSVQTVAKGLQELMQKELVGKPIRTIREDRSLSTNIYCVKKQPVSDCFFFVCPKQAFSGTLCPRQLVVYLFLCKAHSMRLGRSWNSYNDMSRQLGMKRETVIATVQELCDRKMIYKQRRFSRGNKNVYVDNLYFIVQRMYGTIKKKKPLWERGFFGVLTEDVKSVKHSTTNSVYHTLRVLSSPFFGRGSPENEILIIDTNNSFLQRIRKYCFTLSNTKY